MIEISNTKVCTLSVVTPSGTIGTISRAIFKPGVTWAELKGKVPAPRLQGAPFQHWSLTADGSAIQDSETFDESTTIYGVFENTIIVTAETGTEPAQFKIPVVPGTTARRVISELPKFKKAGYSLSFWSLDGSSAIDMNHRFQEAGSISAVWAENAQSIEITIADNNLFKPTASLHVAPGTQWSAIKNMVAYPTPAEKANVFKNWSLTEGGDAIPDGTIFNDPVTIYAVGEVATEFITITFNPAGGSSIDPLLNQPKGILYGYVKQIIEDPVRKTDSDKFDEFAGWALAQLADAELEETYKFERPSVIYAQWVTRLDVTIKNNGEDRKISKVANYWPYSELLAALDLQQDKIPAKHTFRHWSFTQDGEAISSTGKLSRDINAYAVYDPYAVINPHMFGGSGASTVEVPINTTWATVKTQLGTPTLADNTFKHWSLTEGGDPIQDDYAFVGTVAVYAVWLPFVDVIINARGGSTDQTTIKVPKGSRWLDFKANITNPTLNENTFAYWSLTEDGAAIADNQVFDQVSTTIYAKWIPYVEITFETGVGLAIAPKKIPSGTTWAALKGQCNTTATGYRLDHWSLTDAGVAVGDQQQFTEATTLHAVWVKTWVLTFNADGGSPTQSPIVVDDGSTWGQVKNRVTSPSKSGYNFTGWNVV